MIFPTVKKARFNSFSTKPGANIEWKSTNKQKNLNSPQPPGFSSRRCLMQEKVDCTKAQSYSIMNEWVTASNLYYLSSGWHIYSRTF